MAQNIFDVFEVRTDKGGHPELAQAGRFWLRDGELVALEEHSPSGLRALAPPSPYRLVVPVALEPLELKPIERLPASVFEYKRAGMDEWHVLEFSGAATLDGQRLSDEEVTVVLDNLDRGIAEIRYKKGAPPVAQLVEQEVALSRGADIMRDSLTGLGNLLAFRSAQPLLLVVSLRSYQRLWRRNPAEALESAKVLASLAQQLGGQWFELEAGAVGKEGVASQDALQTAQALVRSMGETTLGRSGMGDLLCAVGEEEEARDGIAQVAARLPSGSGIWLDGVLVEL